MFFQILLKNVENIKDKYRQVDIQCEDFVDILLNNESFKVKSPIYRNKTAYFMTGFETFDLWKAVVQSFLYTGNTCGFMEEKHEIIWWKFQGIV